jgi:hypothetical protein
MAVCREQILTNERQQVPGSLEIILPVRKAPVYKSRLPVGTRDHGGSLPDDVPALCVARARQPFSSNLAKAPNLLSQSSEPILSWMRFATGCVIPNSLRLTAQGKDNDRRKSTCSVSARPEISIHL